MIIKTAIALILTASLAGGVVYFGTQGETGQNGEVSLGNHPHKQVNDAETADVAEAPEKYEEPSSSGNIIERLISRENDESKPDSNAQDEDVKEVAIENDLETPEVEQEQRIEVIDVQPDLRANNGTALEKNNFSDKD
jgi:N-acetyl-gamma-glutamylphosphate reductase